MLKLAVSLLLIAGAAAYFTKPGVADAEAALRQQVMAAVAEQDLGDGKSTGEKLALAACRLQPNECYDLLRSGMELSFTDQTLFVRVDLNGFERKATCYGAFGRFVCPGGLRKANG